MTRTSCGAARPMGGSRGGLGGVTWSAPAQLGHPDATNIFLAVVVHSHGTVAMTYLTNAKRSDTFVVALNPVPERPARTCPRDRVEALPSAGSVADPDTALVDCDGSRGPSIAPTPAGFEIVFPATGFNTKAPHDVDLYSSTIDIPIL